MGRNTWKRKIVVSWKRLSKSSYAIALLVNRRRCAMTLQKAIQKFLESRELDNCTPKTIRGYSDRLQYFASWVQSSDAIIELEDLQLDHLRGWIAYLKKKEVR